MRKCPHCRADMQSDGVHAWCAQFKCTFRGYVVVRTGKVVDGIRPRPHFADYNQDERLDWEHVLENGRDQ